MDRAFNHYLTAMGIQRWELKQKTNADVLIITETEQTLAPASQRLLKAMLASVGVHHSKLSSITAIETAQPRLLICLGNKAAKNLLHADVESLRGKRHTYGKDNIPVIVTYHPDELLQRPLDKRKAFNDLRL